MESDIVKIEGELAKLKEAKDKKDKSTTDIKEIVESIKYFMEHLEDLLLDGEDSVKSAMLFSLIFEGLPTYDELKYGTPQLAPFIELKREFDVGEGQMVTLRGIEPRFTG